MKNEKVTFRILLRSPKYPVIVIAEDDIYSAFGIKELGAICYISEPTDDDSYIRIIDNSGEEFLYMPEQVALVPGIARKKWTKNEIIGYLLTTQELEADPKLKKAELLALVK